MYKFWEDNFSATFPPQNTDRAVPDAAKNAIWNCDYFPHSARTCYFDMGPTVVIASYETCTEFDNILIQAAKYLVIKTSWNVFNEIGSTDCGLLLPSAGRLANRPSLPGGYK